MLSYEHASNKLIVVQYKVLAHLCYFVLCLLRLFWKEKQQLINFIVNLFSYIK